MRGFSLLQKLFSIRRVVVFVSLSILALLASSCATGFRDSAAVNLELHFYRWDSICITKPNIRENGFQPVLNVGEVVAELKARNIQRGLAAVVISANYDPTQMALIAQQWKKHLSAQGFNRVVVLRGPDNLATAGLPIVTDSAIPSGNDSLRSAITDASAPPAP